MSWGAEHMRMCELEVRAACIQPKHWWSLEVAKDTPSPKRCKTSDEGSEVKQPKFWADAFPDVEACLGSASGDSEDDSEVCRRWTPNQVRARIRTFLQKTEVKITEFQGMLGVNGNSYNRFMNGKYKDQWNAAENQTYDAATRFFIKEDKLGKQAVGKLRAKPSAKKSGGSSQLPEIQGISTDGLTYLTPGETRRELGKVTKEFNTSVAQLARLAGVPAQSANKFMKAGGDFGGVDNQVYHPFAELVEKFRIACKKPKSKKRQSLENEVAAGRVGEDGHPFLGVDPRGKTWCFAGDRPVISRDDLGRKVIEYQRG